MIHAETQNVAIGSVIAEPIRIDDVTLFDRGSIITDSMKRMLYAYGIDEIYIDPIEVDWFDAAVKDVNKLSRLIYLSLRKLDIESITVCARTMVDNILNQYAENLLKLTLDYDEDTYNHSIRVANLAMIFGIKDHLPIMQLKYLVMGSLLHDIGKCYIPTNILDKVTPLTDKEFNLIKQHPRIGYDMIRDYKGISKQTKLIILQHHENWDGTGYPYGSIGMDTVRLSRIVRICDVYEALCARRSYKSSLSREEVRDYIRDNSGTLFDPLLATKFLEYIPKFLVGEEIRFDDGKGVVVSTSDVNDPIIEFKGSNYQLSELTNIMNYKAEEVK